MQAKGETAQITGNILKDMVQSGKTARRRFMDSGVEIARYGYSPDYGFEYQTLPKNSFFRAKVALTAEAIRVFGPYLYQNNPHRTATARETATPEMAQIAKLIGQYLNYIPGEYNLYRQSRRAIDEAITFGRGVVWTGLHPTKGIICSQYDTVRNLVIDPDAKTEEEITWVARRRHRSRMEATAEYPEGRWKVIPKNRDRGKEDVFPWEKQKDSGADQVVYWEVYATRSLFDQKGGENLLKAFQKDNPQAQPPLFNPRKYLVSDEGILIHECEWEVPFYEDNAFPVSWLDFYDNVEGQWPVSPLEPAIGFQRAINWVVTLLMGKYRFTSRTVGAIVKNNGEGLSDDAMDKVLIGNDIEMLQVNLKGEAKSIKELIQEFNWSQDYLTSGMNLLSLLESRYQKATGLYEILYSGQTPTQSRTATDASVKDRNSQTRIQDMKERVIQWQTAIARKEAMAARFLHKREDIARFLGNDAAQAWGFLVQPGHDTVQSWVQQFVQAGVPVDQAIPMAQQKAAQAVSLDRWRLETDYGIEADSIRRRDIDQRIDSLNSLANQTVPTMMQSMDMNEKALAFDILATQQDAIGSDREIIAKLKMHADQLRQMAMLPPPPAPGIAPPPSPAIPQA